MSAELKLITRLLSRVRRLHGNVAHTSASSGNRRVAVKSWFDLDAGTMNGFTAYVDTWDKSTFRWTILRQSYGATAEEALMNLEADTKSQEARCNTR
jgi:hypothetical protein